MDKISNLKNTIYQIGFWGLFYSVFVGNFWFTTMIPCSVAVVVVFGLLGFLFSFILGGCIVFDAYVGLKHGKLSRANTYSIIAILIFMLLTVLGLIPFDLTFIALLVIASGAFSTKDILTKYVISSTVFLVFTMILGVTGIIPNLIYGVDGVSRVSFGILYPTDFCAHVFFIVMSYAFIKGNKIGIKELACIGLFGVFSICFCRARNTALCLFVALILIGIYVCVNRYRKQILESKPIKLLGIIAALAAPILAVMMTVLSRLYKYKDSSNLPYKLDSFLSGRLMLGRIAFENYSIKPFGQPVVYIGNGGRVDDYLVPDYVYPNLVNLAIVGAVVLFIAVLVLLFAKKVKMPLLIGSVLVITALCFVLKKMLSTNIVVDESLLTFEERIFNGMYFFLDCSYMNTLFLYGWVVLSILLIVYVAVSFRQLSGREWVRLLVLAVVALQCMFEHHFWDLAYCPFFLCLFTKNDDSIVENGK